MRLAILDTGQYRVAHQAHGLLRSTAAPTGSLEGSLLARVGVDTLAVIEVVNLPHAKILRRSSDIVIRSSGSG